MSAKRKAGLTWHPAVGSNLTLADVMQDPPPFRLPTLDAVQVPVLAQTDPGAYLRQQFGRYIRWLEEAVEVAKQQGDVGSQVKLLRMLLGAATKGKKAPGSDIPDPPEQLDLSGLSDEELNSILSLPATKE